MTLLSMGTIKKKALIISNYNNDYRHFHIDVQENEKILKGCLFICLKNKFSYLRCHIVSFFFEILI